MPEPLFDRLCGALSGLLTLVESTRRDEADHAARLGVLEQATHAEFTRAFEDRKRQRDDEVARLDATYRESVCELEAQQARERASVQASLADALARLAEEERQARKQLQLELREALWTTGTLLEAGQKRVEAEQEALRRAITEAGERGEQLRAELRPLLERYGIDPDDLAPTKGPPAVAGESARDVHTLLDECRSAVRAAGRSSLLWWASWPAQMAIGLVVLLIGLVPGALMQPRPLWFAIGVGVALGVVILQRAILLGVIRGRLRSAGAEMLVLLVQAQELGTGLLERTASSSRRQLARIQQRDATDRKKASDYYRPLLKRLAARYKAERLALEDRLAVARETMEQRVLAALEQTRARYQHAREELLTAHDRALSGILEDNFQRVRALNRERSEIEGELQTRWEAGCARFLATAEELQARAVPLDQALSDPTGGAGLGRPPAVPFGSLAIDLPALVDGLKVAQVAPLPGAVDLPAYLPAPLRNTLALEAGPSRAEAVRVLQAVMLRFLTALPPGKVRFTILDPVGLGDNFAAFMHLADADDSLVTGRIWTEASHIDHQLAQLTAHMENVIQKYLRSQFASIEDYNEQAGEVAEPYRVLVVANFPTHFSPQAVRRLISIIQSGAACGVYVLMSYDPRHSLPEGIALEEVIGQALCLRRDGDRFVTGLPEVDRFPLTLDAPPENGRIIEVAQRVGLAARDAKRVEVPFSYVAPSEDEVWRADSRHGITVPLGRVGAVRRLEMRLGRGTSQHVLVAGKTGSGKSTLWHALILNVALRYSPDEVELYLIDFKKGVEFKPYADHPLPHARVIAIEGERELGLSVLQRLDGLLRERGDRFRAAGVNDVASYRQERPDEPCPRVLLIIDEFQELFVEDDRIAQDAALLLDRLVRQGRAFGLHVLLGSQTLGGAYSLARSTLDQMAVRVAMQCSDADAQFILGKDNNAARLLSRPGEAIYNDAAGAVEGNEIFQVTWLTDEQREESLRSLCRRAKEATIRPVPPPLVFESSAPADLSRCAPLLRALQGQERGRSAWLGEAVAIKGPTAAVFQRRTGSHLLIVGQNDESAAALLASSLVSLAAQRPAGQARFVVLDGTGPDEPHAGLLRRVAEGWPHAVEPIDRGAIGPALAALAQEMTERQKGARPDGQDCYVLINGLQRFRELRRGDDDGGFSRRGAERTISPSEHLQALLRDGPAVGIHLLMWCDLLVNLNRTLDRQGTRECGLRVLFQMSAADSSQLLDTPAAGKLGRNWALYYHDEMAQPEKFRPYGVPSQAWLEEVKRRAGSGQEAR